MQDSLIGSTLGDRYQIRAHTSEEMLGRVYLATDTATGSLVHLKVLHPYLTENPEKVRRFAREITATNAVRHPNTVAVVDHGEADALHWLVLEYAPTQALADAIESGGQVSVERACHITAQVAAALAAAHKQGVVHRNLNPSNILLLQNARRGDYVKVRDFGLSRLEGSSDLTAANVRIGNTYYMAPEYIDRQEVDPRGDVYALGCILVFMLTGAPPFEGRPGEVLEMHITHRPPAISQRRAGLPSWLDALVASLLDKEPRNRPSAAGLAEQLARSTSQDLSPPPLLRLDAEGQPVPLTAVEHLLENKKRTALVAGGLLSAGSVLAAGVVAILYLMANT